MGLFELNEKIKVARQIGSIFIQINKLKIETYSDLSYKNKCFYLKNRIPMCYRLFFRRISHKKEYIEDFRIDLNNPFHFACCKWYL